MAATDPNKLTRARDPAWLAHRYDPGRDSIHFIRATRDDHRAATFLTDEFLAGHSDPVPLPRASAVEAAGEAAPIHFIFHSAYCCSTLLARALDLPGTVFTLKEPVILNDLCGWRQRGGEAADVARVLDSAMALLARPFEAGETVLVKPSNLVNPFIQVMLAMRPQSRALLLHAPLRAYLGSIARKGMWGRLWVRELFVKLSRFGLLDFGFSSEELFRQTDLQIAALGWLGQHRLFASLADRFPDRVRTLDSEAMLADLGETMSQMVALFGLRADPDKLAASPAFARHSKEGMAFGAEQRKAAQREAEAVHAEEIDKVAAWAETVASSAAIRLNLPGNLLAR